MGVYIWIDQGEEKVLNDMQQNRSIVHVNMNDTEKHLYIEKGHLRLTHSIQDHFWEGKCLKNLG